MKKYKLVIIATASLLLSIDANSYSSYVIRSPDTSEVALTSPVIPEEIQKSGEEMRKQINEKGYFETYSENAVLLLGQKDKKAPEYIDEVSDPYHAILRKNPNAFPLSFKYKGFASVDKEHLLGFAPSGSYENEKWTGVTGYFNDDTLGTCSLAIFDLPATHGQAVYDAKYITREVNGKPTTKSVEGSERSGFFYSMSWTGQRYEKMFTCANTKPFDKQLLIKMVEYAKVIDKDAFDAS